MALRRRDVGPLFVRSLDPGEMIRVLTPDRDRLQWDFRDSSLKARLGHRGRHWPTANLDPFPAYPHGREEVEQAVAHTAAAWPPGWPVTIWTLDREETGRSNGFSTYDTDSATEPRPTDRGFIVLSGKRIPPHPAVTRYLVAHEWGHHVQWWIERLRGLRLDTLDRGYAEMRGLRGHHRGSGGRWHNSPQEVFACNFRILVAEVECDFWPHPGVERPEKVATVRRWWRDAVKERP